MTVFGKHFSRINIERNLYKNIHDDKTFAKTGIYAHKFTRKIALSCNEFTA